MRPIERIDNFLNLVDWSKLGEQWSISYSDLQDLLQQPNTLMLIGSYWKENPDQRIGQVLINLNLVPDKMDIWLAEEHEILLNQGIAPEDCLYWTSWYDKDNNALTESISRLIKDLDTSHIYAIYDFLSNKKVTVSVDYRTAFKNVLQSRNDDMTTIKNIEEFWDLPITTVEFEPDGELLNKELQ